MVADIRYYTDEHVHPAVVDGLIRRGIEVLRCQDAGFTSASDEIHLEFATGNGYVIFTQDDDFLKLHARGVPHRGIVYAHQRTPIGRIVQGLVLIHQVLQSTDMRNHVELL